MVIFEIEDEIFDLNKRSFYHIERVSGLLEDGF